MKFIAFYQNLMLSIIDFANYFNIKKSFNLKDEYSKFQIKKGKYFILTQ